MQLSCRIKSKMSKALRQNLGLSNTFEHLLILNQQFPKENSLGKFPSSAAVLSTFSHSFLEVSLVWHYFNTLVSPVLHINFYYSTKAWQSLKENSTILQVTIFKDYIDSVQSFDPHHCYIAVFFIQYKVTNKPTHTKKTHISMTILCYTILQYAATFQNL